MRLSVQINAAARFTGSGCLPCPCSPAFPTDQRSGRTADCVLARTLRGEKAAPTGGPSKIPQARTSRS